jgi:hypothetical protein
MAGAVGNAGRGGTAGTGPGGAGGAGPGGTGGTGGGVCTPGMMTCSNLTPQVCTSQGQWQSGTPCPFVCSQGQCIGTCSPGARRCSPAGLPQLCNASGAWLDQTPCPFVCTGDGACGGQCVPPSMRCQGGQNQICDASGFWQNAGASTIQLLQNPNFDTTPFVWAEISRGSYEIVAPIPATNPPIVAPTPPYVAFLGGYDGAQDWIFQHVTFPAGAVAFTLSFSHLILTDEYYLDPVDIMAPYVWDQIGGAVSPDLIAVWSNADAATSVNWTRETLDLPVNFLAGRTLEFGFVGENDGYPYTPTLFMVDSVSLTATACP